MEHILKVEDLSFSVKDRESIRYPLTSQEGVL